jgi:hypothetical protein
MENSNAERVGDVAGKGGTGLLPVGKRAYQHHENQKITFHKASIFSATYMVLLAFGASAGERTEDISGRKFLCALLHTSANTSLRLIPIFGTPSIERTKPPLFNSSGSLYPRRCKSQ